MSNTSDSIKILDELDKLSIAQLHDAVLQFSSNCFELKKLCITVLVSASALVTTFGNGQTSYSIFVAGAFVIVFFWILDSQSYYYQTKLRLRMSELADKIAERNSPGTQASDVGMPLKSQVKQTSMKRRIIASLVNTSMVFYYILLFLILLLEIIT